MAEGDGEKRAFEQQLERAVNARAQHFKDQADSLTLESVRRLLEKDLGLEKLALDAHKRFIRQYLEKKLDDADDVNSNPTTENVDKDLQLSKEEEKASPKQEEATKSDEMRDRVKSRKEAAPRRNLKKLEQPKKRKSSNNADIDVSHKKKKTAKRQKEDNNFNEDRSLSEDGNSQSSVERSALRKEKSAPGYGRRVENLKSIIKACGMSVPPSIYKKVKQVPDDERETFLVKELEGILSREGLSKNPSEKEIKDCRKRKDRARELEGIDMSNIISSSRRRSTFSFVAPKKPEIRATKDKVDSKNSKKEENNDKVHNDDNKEEEEKEKDKEDEEEVKEKKEEKEEDEVVEEEVEEEEEDDEEEDNEDESEEFDEDDNEESD